MTPQRFPFALSVPGVALLSFALLSFAISPILATTAKAKPTCAIVGDSIAAGAGKYVSGCRVNAKIGIPSGAVIPRVDPSAEINVVSAGSNDPDNPNLLANLVQIRDRAKRVVWILPIDARARAAVQAVAEAHQDPVITFDPGGDRVHPRSEEALAKSIDAVVSAQGS
jgi:hypothetical protein